MKKTKSVLVVFGKELPKKSEKWFRQFDKVIGPKELVQLTDPGSIQEAYHLVDELSRLTLSDGRRLSKLFQHKGYELWWIFCQETMWKFCLVYTKYHRLLTYLKEYDKVYLDREPGHGLFPQVDYFRSPRFSPDVFTYFLEAHNCQCKPIQRFQFKKFFYPFGVPFGVWVQVALSFIFLPWLVISRKKLMVWTSDLFDPPHDFDFRYRFIYEELRARKVPFVEFIRSLESTPTILAHAWRRKRAVVYSGAVKHLILHFFRGKLDKKEDKELFKSIDQLCSSSNIAPEERFWFSIALHYLKNNIRGITLSIEAMRCILRLVGVKTAIFPTAGSSRTLHEILACKINGVKTVGIQHGAAMYAQVSEYMPSFDGDKTLTVDIYGVWSRWWKEYYNSHSKAFRPEQVFISGPMRPFQKKITPTPEFKKGPIKVLFLSEQLADPKEVMPYLSAVLEEKDFSVCLKFRPYRDGFEGWLRENRPEILKKLTILRGNIHEAISQADVVVGAYSTGVLEAVFQEKPFVFFNTVKWGDNFALKSFDSQARFFAENPKDLVYCVEKSVNIKREDLERVRERFFNTPGQNGSKWVVEQAIKFLNESNRPK